MSKRNTELLLNDIGERRKRALNMVFDWLDIHKQELLLDWEKAQKGEPLENIEPLK